jgi:hypothetical protein
MFVVSRRTSCRVIYDPFPPQAVLGPCFSTGDVALVRELLFTLHLTHRPPPAADGSDGGCSGERLVDTSNPT